jgi:diacylglycerol kinase family enzyme
VALAFLPGGTANVMAHELGLPQDPVQAVRLLAQGEDRPIRPGMVGGRAFLLMAGFGFDGMAVHRVSPRLKSRVGKLAYVVAGLQAFAARQPLLRVSGGADTVREAHWVVVSRARHYAGPYVIDPAAGLERPELGLVAVRRSGLLPLLVGALALRLRRPVTGATWWHGTMFHIQAAAPVWAHVDGETFGSSREFTVTLAPQPLLLRFPARARL